MRSVSILFIISVFVFACRPTKKVQKIQEAMSTVDTTSVMVDTINNNKSNKVDSANLTRAVYARVIQNKIDFTTFSAKVKVDYQGKETSDNVTAFVRIRKDSLIWLSLRGALGIEGARVQITRDSVLMYYTLKKEVTKRSINFLQEVTQLPFDFQTLQDLIVGNPVYVDSNIISYKTNAANELLVLMSGTLFKHLVTLDNTDFKILHSKLDDVNASRNRTCDITFSDYNNSTGISFSTKRKISVAEKSKLDIELDFKSYVFDEPVSFPLPDERNFKRL